MADWNIVNRETILQNIAAGLNYRLEHKVADLTVTFYCPDGTIDFSVPDALDYLANDIYWNEEANWADATSAKVRVL